MNIKPLDETDPLPAVPNKPTEPQPPPGPEPDPWEIGEWPFPSVPLENS